MRELVLVGVGGALGSVLRYGLGRLAMQPWGTFSANIFACLVLGFLTAKLAAEGNTDTNTWRLLLGIGFCGGLSTFSTLMLELVQFGQKGETVSGIAYLAVSVVVGALALVLGLWVGK